ncbi:MAG: PaaI family thioesterase [Candidatus Bipolaricaulota bacterium]
MSEFNWTAEENRCFGCGDNPRGLGLQFEKDGDWLAATTSLDRHFQGFRTSAHGGIIATLLDEASSWAVMAKTKHLAPSFKLNCEFFEPVPLEEEITTRAKVVEQRHGIALSRAEVVDRSGTTLAKAEIKCKVLEEEIETDLEELTG